MIYPGLTEYIGAQRALGISDEQIKILLTTAGWQETDIAEALEHQALQPSPSAAQSGSSPIQNPSHFSARLILISIVVLLLISGSVYAAYSYRKKKTDSAITAATTTQPPAGLKAPYAYSDTLEMLTGWVPSGQTSCTNMQVLTLPIQFDAVIVQQKILGGTSRAVLYPKVQPDGTFSVLIDKGKNVEVTLVENTASGTNAALCLVGIQFASATSPLEITDKSTAIGTMIGTNLNIGTSADVTRIQGYKGYQPFEAYLVKNLPTTPLSTLTNPKGKYFGTYIGLLGAMIKQ